MIKMLTLYISTRCSAIVESLLTMSLSRSWVAWETMLATSGETSSSPRFLAATDNILY